MDSLAPVHTPYGNGQPCSPQRFSKRCRIDQHMSYLSAALITLQTFDCNRLERVLVVIELGEFGDDLSVAI